MTTPTSVDAGARTARSGTVFDIGYRSYTGEREGRRRPRLAVLKDGIRISLGLGRGPRAKVLPWLFLALGCVIALIMALIAGAAERFAGPGSAERLNLPSHGDYYGFASIILFVMASVVGPELLCRDKRDGVIHLYLVRPLTGSDYLGARWLAFLLVMLVAAWLPQCILFAGLAMGDAAPMTYLSKHWLDVPRFLLAGAVMATYHTTIALLAASFTTRRAYASVFLVGLFVITTPFTAGVAQELPESVGRWVSMFNLTNIPVHVNDLIFGEVSELTEDAPAAKLGASILVAWYLLWTLLPAGILWSRYRKLTP